MMNLNLSHLSTEYIQVPVSIIAAGTPVNPTTDVVQFAFITGRAPISGDWVVGSWDTAPGGYLAQCLVGPGGGVINLAVGTYQIWLKIFDNPETPVRPVGLLVIT